MSIGKGGGQGVGRPPDQEIEDAFATAQRQASVDVWNPDRPTRKRDILPSQKLYIFNFSLIYL